MTPAVRGRAAALLTALALVAAAGPCLADAVLFRDVRIFNASGLSAGFPLRVFSLCYRP